ncbi:ATP-binding protein [Halobaculum limi]|uniref:ATP-binding protein n=1 Tax=Halobaculum limi TaxID=3031916 RepID=UPI002405DEEE|nr:ATP-binding protein [Halobaculum sp. YSMS11]
MSGSDGDGFTPNPYNFLNPVSEEQRFADREEELQEIRRYLSQAAADNYYHIGITGNRAAGKSSLLNRVEEVADEGDHLAVKISLDSQIVQDQLKFFKELLDSIMAEGADKGVIGDSLLDSFRNKVESLDPDVEVSLGYGSTYLRAMQSQNPDPDIPQRVLSDDLEDLYEKVASNGKKSIVLLLDEADLLSKNDAILQKIRNVFSDIDGYNLVLSGTEELFERTDEVFSPMSRLFKRISLGPFESQEKTKECITKPLSEDEEEDLDDQCVGEIHGITGGSPYEINLIAHHMYRRYNEGADEITLTPEVLDDVAEELDRIRESGHHEIADDVKRLLPNQLQVLVSLLEFPRVPKEWLVEFCLLDRVETIEPDNLSSVRSSKEHTIDSLSNQGMIQEDEDGNLSFAGSEFDKTYLKYYAASEGVIDDVGEFRPGMMGSTVQNLYQKLVEEIFLTDEFSEYRVHTVFDRGAEVGERLGEEMDVGEGKQLFMLTANLTVPAGESRAIVEFSPDEREKFYQNLSNATRFRCDVEWMDQGFVSQVRFVDEGESQSERLEDRLNTLGNKLEYLGYDILLEEEVQYYAEAVEASESSNLEAAIQLYEEALEINSSFARAWANKGLMHQNIGETGEALNCYDEALELRPSWAQVLKQKGIILVDEERPEEALSLLEQATDENSGDWNSWHNKGRALMNLGRFEDAVDSFERAKKLNSESPIPVYAEALCHLNLGDFNRAIPHFETLLEDRDQDHSSFPPMSEVNHNYAIALSEVGEYEEALEYYQKVVEEQPGNNQAWYNKAMAEMELGKGEEAIESLKQTGITDALDADLPELSESEIEQLSTPLELEEENSAQEEEE